MYSLGCSLGRTLADYYRRWAEQEHSPAVRQTMEETLQAAIREVLEFDPEATPDMTQEELICRADQLACFSAEYDRLTLLGLHTYLIGLTYYRVHASSCLNCVLFAAMLNPHRVGILLPEEFAAEYDWKRLLPCYEGTMLKHVGILVDGFGTDDPQKEDSQTIAHIWEAAEDKCYCVLLEDGGSFTEIEDGYPLEIDKYWEVYVETEPDAAFLARKQAWLAQPKLSREAASKELYAKKERYAAYSAKKAAAPKIEEPKQKGPVKKEPKQEEPKKKRRFFFWK